MENKRKGVMFLEAETGAAVTKGCKMEKDKHPY